ARETLELIDAINRVEPRWRVVGILDDDPGRHGARVHGIEIIGPAALARELPDARVCACVASPGRPAGRMALVRRLGLDPDRYATLGPGSVLHATTVLTADVSVGAHVAVMPAVVLTHDDVLADGVTLGAGARIAGGVRIGESAYIGSGALVREGIAVGAGAVVGMGAVVTRDVPAGETWAGVPARR